MSLFVNVRTPAGLRINEAWHTVVRLGLYLGPRPTC